MPYKSEVEGALKITEIKIQRENKKIPRSSTRQPHRKYNLYLKELKS